MKVLVIGDKLTCMAFALGGIATMPVSGREDTRTALETALARPDVGLILITEKMADMARELVDEAVFRIYRPLLLEIPDTEGPLSKGPPVSAQVASLLSR